MATPDEITHQFKLLAEGVANPEDWVAWWNANLDGVSRVIKPGQLIRLKQIVNRSPPKEAVNLAQQEVWAILDKLKIAYVRNASYDGGFREIQNARNEHVAFMAEVVEIASRDFHASCDEHFVQRVKEAFRESNTPVDLRSWLVEYLRGQFVYIDTPPVWIDEPAWPIVDGVPAVFVTQYKVEDNPLSESSYAAGLTLYVFGYRQPISANSYEIKHVVVEQFEFP